MSSLTFHLPATGAGAGAAAARHHLQNTPTIKPEVVTLTTAVTTHCRKGHLTAAASTFSALLAAGHLPSPITVVTLLSALSDAAPSSLPLGASIHALLVKSYRAVSHHDAFLHTSLINLYAKSGDLGSARKVFDEMGLRNSVAWNAIINGYVKHGHVGEAVELFDSMPSKDKMAWTAMINGFVKNRRYEEAVGCFQTMLVDGVEVDYVTIIVVVAICADLGLLGQGMWLHCYAEKKGIAHVRLSNAFVDMYFRCGRVELARQVFNRMPKRDRTRVSWNSMIVGLAVNGHAEDALEHFAAMQEDGFVPDGASFTGALTACSHAGMVEEGLQYYDKMRICRIKPSVEHYGCIVDLLGRAGRIEDAAAVVESMPMAANAVVLGSLLAACRAAAVHLELGEKIVSRLVELEPECESSYVLLSNMYAAVGEWDNAGKLRGAMRSLGVKKEPGFSAVEIDGNMHEFAAGDMSHCHSEHMCGILKLLQQEMKECQDRI